MDAKAALMHAHRNNIRRYRRLLETHLTDAERDYIELRLSEERATAGLLALELMHESKKPLEAPGHFYLIKVLR